MKRYILILSSSLLILPNLLILSVQALPREKDAWIELTTPGFTIYSNSSRKNTARIAGDLEQLRATLAQLAGMRVNSPVPTHIYVFKNEARFKPYKPLYEGRPAELAGYFQSRPHGNFIAVDGNPSLDPSEIVYHEYVHYFLASNFPSVPAWLGEGLAEFYSSFEVVRDQAKVGDPIFEHVNWLRRNTLIPLEELFAIDQDSPDYNEGSRRGVFYAQSWALVHFLLLGNEERQGQISRYFALTIQGVGQDDAFVQAFGTSYEELQKELQSYLRRQSMRYSIVDLEPQEENAYQVRAMAYSEVLVRLGNLLEDMEGREPETAEHFQRALKIQPEDARALAGLAHLAERQERLEEALALLRRAVKASSGDFLISYRYASSLLDSESDQAESRQAARDALRASLKSNPEFAPAWALLAYAFTFEPEVSDEARRAGETAHKMLPSRADVASHLLMIHARRSERREAERLFARFFAIHNDLEVVARARAVLLNMDLREAQRLMDSHRDEEALKLLESLRGRAAGAENRGLVEENIRQLRSMIAESRFIARYNEAISLLNQGDETAAKLILEALVAETEDSQAKQAQELLDQVLGQVEYERKRQEVLRASELLGVGQEEQALSILEKIQFPAGSEEKRRIDEQIAEIRRVLKHNGIVDRFSEAITLFNRRDFKGAQRILEGLLPLVSKESREYREIRKLLADAKAEIRFQGG